MLVSKLQYESNDFLPSGSMMVLYDGSCVCGGADVVEGGGGVRSVVALECEVG